MFISVVVLALLAMQIYFKRGMQGKIKDMAEQISDGVLYNPNTTESGYSTRAASRTETFYERGESGQTIIYDSTNRTGGMQTHPETVEDGFLGLL